MNQKLTEEHELSSNDPVLATLIQTIPRPQIDNPNSVFQDLMSCIIEQQIQCRSTKNIFRNMLQKAELAELNPSNFHIFEEKAIAHSKISMQKLETIQRVVEFWQLQNIDWSTLHDDEVTAHLSTIKGIGKWTMDMILLFTLKRPTIFPVDDFHLKQIMISAYNLNPTSKLKSQLMNVASHWENHKSLATLYLLEYKKKLKTEKLTVELR
jgi:DNA-3-methyladenine glycosylase II